MGYNIAGIFSDPQKEEKINAISNEARSRWPFLLTPAEKTLFPNHLQLFIDLNENDCLNDEEADQILEDFYSLEDSLPEFTCIYPTVRFVFIVADCFGGTCLYRGFVLKNGKIEFESNFDKDCLSTLLNPIGIQIVENHFELFQRSYLASCK